MKQYRHGDLFFQELSQFPDTRLVKSWVEGDTVTLMYGEATGHSHKLTGDFTLYRDKSNAHYFEVHTAAKLTHEEHNTIELPAGKYAMIRQREYTPKEIVYVVD